MHNGCFHNGQITKPDSRWSQIFPRMTTISNVSELRMEMVTYATALDDLFDESHDTTDELQSCALDAMTKEIRAQPKHVLQDLGL